MTKVIIVGAGIGGLCSAIRLLNSGYKVKIIEKESTIGGKVNIREECDFKFDLTASILMTPNIYKDFFNDIGRDYKDYLQMEDISHLYRVNYYDKSSYDFYSNRNEMIRVLEKIESGSSKEYFDLIDKSLKKYLLAKECILDKPMVEPEEIFNLSTIEKLTEIKGVTNSASYISSKVHNEKLRDYLIFKTMYIGINPYANSNIYTLIPAISQAYGFGYIRGGFYNYIRALEKLIEELGGEIELNNEVYEILTDNNKVLGVKSKAGIYKSDVVICNADYPYAIDKLLNESVKEFNYNKKNIEGKEYSCSVFMIYLGLKKKYNSLKLHNIYINNNFKEGIEEAFKGVLPKEPSLYIYSPSAIDNSICKEGESMINIMVRVPNLSYKKIIWNDKTISDYRNIIMKVLKNIKELDDIEENIIYEGYLTPKDFEAKFNAYYGNAFGLSHKLMQSSYMRAHLKSKTIKGLYYIGSSTHPGNGVSVIIEGSKVLADLINREYL